MGSEKNTSVNMVMPIPVAGLTSSPYWDAYLVSCLGLVDTHDHTSGKGAVLTQGSIQVSDDFSFRDYGATSVDFVQYTNPTTYSTTPGNASTYFMNGDYYIKDGSGTSIQLTIGGGLNASLVGGFTGDYALSGAYCVFVQADNEYKFFLADNTMSGIVTGSLEIRSKTLNKDQFGLKIQTTGNIPATYTWTVPSAASTNVGSILNLDSNGTMTYLDTASFIRTTGAQTKSGTLTLSSLPVITDTNAPGASNSIRRDYVDGVISALTKSSVGLSNVDNTADSNKNVSSALTLTNSRTINGVSFNGSSNITIPPGPLPSTNDGIEYVALNGGWTVNSGGSFPEAPVNSNQYARSGGAWAQVEVREAPNDTNQYVRKALSWQSLVVPSASSVSIDLTANSNGITSGNVVELTSTGGQNVQNIYHCEAPTIGSLLTLDGTNDVITLSLARKGDTEAFMSFHKSSGLATLGVLTSDNPPLLKQTLNTTSNDFAAKCAISRLSDDYFAVVGLRNGATNCTTGLASVIGTNAVTLSTVALVGGSANIQPATCALTSSNWFVAYVATDGLGMYTTCASNGTNAPIVNTNAAFLVGSSGATYLSLGKLDSTYVMAIQMLTGDKTYVARLGINGTNAPTKSSSAQLDGTNNCTFITQSSIDSNHTLCAYNNATTSNGCLAVIQANGTNAPTVVGRAVFDSAAVFFCSLTAHTSNTHGLTWKSNTGGRGYFASIFVDSNYNLTLSATTSINSTNNLNYNSVAAISPTSAIIAYADNSSGDGFAGTLTLTPTPIISGQLVGIAATSATNGASATVAVGPVVTGTFTAGLDYYVSGAGGISTNATPVHVLKAKSTTEGVLDLRGNPAAGKQNRVEILTEGANTFTFPYDAEYTILLAGGGGGGARSSSGLYGGNGGNSGNVVKLVTKQSAGSILSISNGAGGAAQSTDNTAGNAGSAGTMIVNGKTYTANGGLGGTYTRSYYTGGGVQNPPNTMSADNIPGGIGIGMQKPDGSYAGPTPIIGKSISLLSSGAGLSGSYGCGGTGGTTSGGAGGTGCCIIEWTHGS